MEGRRGVFLVNVNDMYIGASMLAYGEWSDEEISVMALNLPPDGVRVVLGTSRARCSSHALPSTACMRRHANQARCGEIMHD